MERQTGIIKAVRSYYGGEYLFGEFKDFVVHQLIVSQLTALRTPQQNDVYEKGNRKLLKMVRCMTTHSSIPDAFWDYVLDTTTYILNLVPYKSVPLTPHEMWTGCKPSLNHLRIWVYPAYILPKESKLEPRFEMCSFLGYTKASRGSYFYLPNEQKVFMSTNA